MKITLRNREFDLFLNKKTDSRLDGECSDTLRMIFINPRIQNKKNKLETLIHEMLHCCQNDLDEDMVYVTARDITHVLWRLGYRQRK